MRTPQKLGAVLLALFFSTSLQALEVAGVKIDDQIKAGDAPLVLNGAGVRSRFFVKVYVAALYTTEKMRAAPAVINAAVPRRISLCLLRDVDADTFYNALYDGLRANLSEAELSALQPRIDQFAGIMKKTDSAKNGDRIALDFTADGVAVSVNGQLRGQVAGAAFAHALMQVWLGERPVEADLKKALLGG